MSSAAALNTLPPISHTAPRPAVDHSKTTSLVRKCFEMLKAILTFPLRYLGSKTWSIPGLILRTPIILFKRLFDKTVSLKQELFGSGYHFRFEKTLTPQELKPYLPYACSIPFVCKTNPEYIPPGWKPLSSVDLNLPISAQGNCFLDPTTGLKASLLEKENELILTFGTLVPEEFEGLSTKFSKRLKSKYIAQILLGGSSPAVFKQADELVKALLNHPHIKPKKLTLTGHCFGGAIASYVALKNDLSAVCFNPFPLGVGLQYDLGKKRLREADKYITHITAKTDFLSDRPICSRLDPLLNILGIRTPGSFGHSFIIPTAYETPAKSHHYILGSIMQHLGYDNRTKPCELPAELKA